MLGVATAPIIVLLSLLVSRDGDRARALIRLARVGQGRSTIRVWKLRTMRSAGAAGVAGDAALTRGGTDDRITPIGRFLRRHRLDELPQLWNVLTGDMAIIGPRPEAPAYVGADDERWDEVLSARPGIAGPTQLLVHAWERDAMADESWERTYLEQILPVKLAIDRWYVREATPCIDLAVAWALIGQFVAGRPPMALRRRVAVSVPEIGSIPSNPSRVFVTRSDYVT